MKKVYSVISNLNQEATRILEINNIQLSILCTN